MERVISEFPKDAAAALAAGGALPLAEIVESTSDCVGVADPSGRILFLNRAFKALMGLAADEDERTLKVPDFHPPGVVKVVEAGIREAARSGVWRGETVLRTRGGQEIPVSQVIMAHRDAGGGLRCYSSILRDIGEHVRSEEVLRRSEHRLRRAQAIAQVGSWELDLRTNALFWSEETFRIFGLEPGAHEPSVDDFFARVHPADRERVRRADEIAVRDGTPYRVQHRIVLPCGEVRMVHEQAELVRDATGCAVRFEGAVRDVTEQVRVEQELRTRESQYRVLVDNAPEAIVVFDLQFGRFVEANPRAMEIFACPRETLLTLGPVDLSPEFQPDGRSSSEVARQMVERAVAGEMPVFEWTHRDAQGREIPCRVSLARLPATDRVLIRGCIEDEREQRRAQTELAESRRRLQSIFDVMGGGVVVHGGDGRIIECNPGAERVLGLSRDQIMGRTEADSRWRLVDERGETLNPGSTPSEIARLTGKSMRDVIVGVHTPEGELRWLSVNSEPVLREDGTAEAVVASFTDITARRNAEGELRKSKRFIEGMTKAVPHVMYAFDLVERRIVYENRSLFEDLGYPRPADTVKALAAMLHPDDVQRVIGSLGSWTDTEDGRVVESEFRLKDAAGRWRWMLARDTVFARGPDGRVRQIVGTAQDITERKQAEDALRESEARFRVLADSAPVMIWMSGPDGRLQWFSKGWREFTGRPVELEMRDWGNHVHPDDFGECHAVFLEAFKARRPFTLEYRYCRHDGEYRWLLDSGVPRFAASGEFAGYIGSCIDLSERRQLEEQLRQSQKMEAVGQLAGGIAHDFNNLLTVILGYANLLSSTLTEGGQDWSASEQIREAGERAAGLTRQLLAFSRRSMVAPQTVDLGRLVRESEGLVRRLVGEDVLVSVTLGAPTFVRLDPTYVNQVLLNLAANARDAMPRGGRLEFGIDRAEVGPDTAESHPEIPHGVYACLTATDSGMGIPADIMDRVFEPFFTTKGPGRGTGLGLPVVHGIVKQAGGHIEVKSEVGSGTTFRLYFPLVAPAEPEKVRARPVAAAGGDELVILVEDEMAVRELCHATLRSLGYRVINARDGAEGARILEEYRGRTRLLITDVVMPGMSGRELVEIAHKMSPALPVLYMSGYTDDAVVRHGVCEAEMEFIQKPFTPAELGARVRAILDRAGIENTGRPAND